MRVSGFAIPIAIALGCFGCASSQNEQVQKDVNAFTEEQAADRLVARGRAYAAVGDLTRAEEYFAGAIAQGGDESKILPMLLTVCIQDGRYRVAIEYAERFLRKHPTDPGARFVLGTLYAGVGDAETARNHFERVLSERPLNAEAHFALATLMRDHRMDAALASKHFREYIRLNPDGPHVEEAKNALSEAGP